MSRAGLLNCLAGFLVRIGGYPVNPAAVALAIVVIWMRSVMAKLKRQLETPSGTFGALPHSVLDSVAFTGASHPAKALLLELVRQLNGRNNGRLQLSTQWLATRGWTSRDVILRARRQLVERGLIVQAKQGGLNSGASQYAVTWLAVSNFVGLDITAMDYHPGAWSFLDKLPLPKNAKPVPPPGHVKPLTVPPPGTANALTVPSAGTVSALLAPSTVPPHGNNVITNIPTVNSSRPIVGKKGRSGKSAPANIERAA